MTAPSPDPRIEDVATRGQFVPMSRFYDAMTWILSLGRERQLRERTVALARVEPGDRVLEVGCGTGSLTIAAKAVAGPAGEVYGIDPSKQMIAAARRKAARKGVDVRFESGAGEKLRFGDGEFDRVLCSLVLHHLPPDLKVAVLTEIRRVLKPGGIFLAVDFGPGGHSLVGHLGLARHVHGHQQPEQVSELLTGAGFIDIESGPAGFRGMAFWRAKAP
jgi:demethylmenaquinone methyltransferase/2-methoxy-6-polyprenyl-1,4-benzoquinol methylase/phosphoethanolamine N-methyltransferase